MLVKDNVTESDHRANDILELRSLSSRRAFSLYFKKFVIFSSLNSQLKA
jgi:hypothetical protein